ncbi:hypothetical protein PMZ80_001692 [Knufia obscura]|uniref:Uncharacterized protein n=1 Tax=Knufia obscura TaxID=1635080 RepID=A0ABR0S4V7_9EURO|nr:hypothetical protein PMZ80_001692 [Knufia obscura]
MSTDTPSREPTLEQRIHMTSSFQSFLHNASICVLVGAPILIALPPRKLDLYTFSLTGAFIASANHMVKERTGAGMLYQLPGARLPPAAIEYQERMKLREGGRRLLEEGERQQQERPSIQEQLQRHQTHREPQGLEKAAKDIWMGGEKEGWKERRLAEEQKKLDEGEGYGSMIVDQIWEVWNQGQPKSEEQKEKEEVVESRKKDKLREQEFPDIGKEG